MAKTKNDVTERKPLNIASGDDTTLPAAEDFGDEAGGGLENISRDEQRIPFLTVLQSNSPQCRRPADGGVAGAQPGMIMNTATGELFDGSEGLMFAPAVRNGNYVEYVPRESGGGFVGIHPLDNRPKQFGKIMLPNGNELVQTFYIFGVFAPRGSVPFPAIVAFKSTQIKVYQNFVDSTVRMMYRMPSGRDGQAALWMHRWRLRTTLQRNKKGEFYGWRLHLDELLPDGREAPYHTRMLPASHALRQAAKALHDSTAKGEARADYSNDLPAAPDNDDPM